MKSSVLAQVIEEDFKGKHPEYHKSRREGLAALTAVMLDVRSANLNELAVSLPRAIGVAKDRYQYIERLLKNEAIESSCVIQPYALEVIERLAAKGETVILQFDQSHINDTNEVLMLSVRMKKRALPVAWVVCATQGNIGWKTQKELLDKVFLWLPEDINILFAADRFYGNAQLIGWCQNARWGYRIRLKGNLTLTHEGGELSTGDIVSLLPKGIRNAELYGSGVHTHIGVLHEKGHREPWIIAMDTTPSPYTVLDYGMRWGIENMFSDFKSRGFGLMQSQIQIPQRMERLILIMALALYWAVSCGMTAEHETLPSAKKKAR